eukprot:523846-Rhodomonas_salina.1
MAAISPEALLPQPRPSARSCSTHTRQTPCACGSNQPHSRHTIISDFAACWYTPGTRPRRNPIEFAALRAGQSGTHLVRARADSSCSRPSNRRHLVVPMNPASVPGMP